MAGAFGDLVEDAIAAREELYVVLENHRRVSDALERAMRLRVTTVKRSIQSLIDGIACLDVGGHIDVPALQTQYNTYTIAINFLDNALIALGQHVDQADATLQDCRRRMDLGITKFINHQLQVIMISGDNELIGGDQEG